MKKRYNKLKYSTYSRRIRGARKKKSILRNRLFWDFILILILITLIFYFLFFSDIFKIKEIEARIGESSLKKDIENVLEKSLGENFFLANSSLIEKEVLRKYSQIEKAEVKKKFPNGLVLEIKKREPVAIFCLEVTSDCFLIDKQGIIFGDLMFRGRTSKHSEEGLITIFSEEETKNLGEKVISEEKMNQILEIYDNLEKKLKINIDRFILIGDKRLNVKTKSGWEIYFSFDSDIKFNLTKLKLVLEKEIPPLTREELEYVDLRFSKLYYKYK